MTTSDNGETALCREVVRDDFTKNLRPCGLPCAHVEHDPLTWGGHPFIEVFVAPWKRTSHNGS